MGRGVWRSRWRRSFAEKYLHVFAIRLLRYAFDQETPLPDDSRVKTAKLDGSLVVTYVK